MLKLKILNRKSKTRSCNLLMGMLLEDRVLIVCILVLSVLSLSAYADEAKEQEALYVAEKAFGDGFYNVSIDLLERFLKNYPASPNRPKAKILIGQCYFQQNKYLDALAKFEEVSKDINAKDVQDAACYWIAEVHFKGNSFAQAAEYYRKLIEGFPQSAYLGASYYSLGWCLYQEGQYSEAVRYFKLAKDKFPKGVSQEQDALFKIIESLYALKDYPALKVALKDYLESNAKDGARIPYLYFYQAEADYYTDNFSAAIEGYSKVITSDIDRRVRDLSLLGKAWAYLKMKQYQDAEAVFQQIDITTLDPDNRNTLMLAKAMMFCETNRFNQAKETYDQLLASSPDPLVLSQAYLGKADALYNLAEYSASAGIYQQALKDLSSSQSQEVLDKLHYGLAWAYLKEGNFKEAIAEFQKIVKYTDDKTIKVSTLCHIADTYQDLGEYDKASSTYDSILKDYPDSLYADYIQYQLGVVLLKSFNYSGAALAFANLRARFPQSRLLDDASYALGLAYFQKEDYNASKDIFTDFQEKFKESPLKSEALYLLGTSCYNLGEFNQAIEVFKNIIRLYPQDVELVQKAEYEIADCLYRMGKEEEAMSRFKALRIKYPDSRLTPEIIWWLGEYYYRHNQLNMARRYFALLIKDFPKSDLVASAYYALGSSYAQEEKYSEAIENFEKVAKQESDLSATASIAVADIYLKQNNPRLALKIYNQVAASYQNLAGSVYPKIAEAYRMTQDYQQALDFYNKALESVPVKEMAGIQIKLAETLEAQGRSPEAIEEYMKVAYLYSENDMLTVRSLLRVAGIYEKEDKFKEALNIYNRVSAMNVEEAKYAREKSQEIKTMIK